MEEVNRKKQEKEEGGERKNGREANPDFLEKGWNGAKYERVEEISPVRVRSRRVKGDIADRA